MPYLTSSNLIKLSVGKLKKPQDIVASKFNPSISLGDKRLSAQMERLGHLLNLL